ncbi:hypothetical protein LO771_28865 [Streptacidiphilus sp. ASG 303]|uniref:hypothetical protein n=1 Tax=Streptacidiphilus sp. ASG 303 TaxID=2896847 RepID=UPI001E28B54A|nr:hypothetical protein [Streptacidiphilus sp. ASG 303]MCD0486285.1 hypothetical protein [Streptacidiphilus sp. ASG 303]
MLDPSGKLLDTFCIGDDITALTTDPGGRIWTVYADEGIYGDNPLSWKGMAGWDSAGRAVWSPEGRLPALPLGGWTAATEGQDVWLAWYPGGSPGTVLTRITPSTGETANLLSPVRNPDGLAVWGNRAVLTVRDHNRRSVEVVRAELEGTGWTVTDRRRLRTPGRVVLHCGQGRDGVLWLRAGHTWLRIRA